LAPGGTAFARHSGMKPLLFSFPLLVLAVSGCGGASDEGRSSVVLKLLLPSALSKSQPRGKAFQDRARGLDLVVTSRSGEREEKHFGPDSWNQIELPSLAFPRETTDQLNVVVRVWDHKRDGTPREFPVLKGTGTLKASEMPEKGPGILPIRLHLKIPVADYDK
jgi:hypothetical protein